VEINDHGYHAVIADFGFAVTTSPQKKKTFNIEAQPCGNVGHAAPEILSSYNVQKSEGNTTYTIDFTYQPHYELGVLLYEIYHSDIFLFEEIQWMNELVPSNLSEIIMKLISRNPLERPKLDIVISSLREICNN